MSGETVMRRRPRQARSQQRVEHLLNTAAQLFDEMGYEAVTTNAIAARAGISIGSLYQFFPNKQAVVDALVERYLREMAVVFTFEAAQPLRTTIDQMIDKLALFTASHAGFQTLFVEADVAHHIHAAIVSSVDTLLAAHVPMLDAHIRKQTVVAGIAIVKGMMKLTTDQLEENIPLSEVKLALLAFTRAVLVRAGIPLPADLQDM
jgi:AcrR family transcriptional regulator